FHTLRLCMSSTSVVDLRQPLPPSFHLAILHPTRPLLFPYTTLFRSLSVTTHSLKENLHVVSGWSRMRRFGISDGEVPNLTNDVRSEEHTSELQSRFELVCRILLEKNNRC